MVWLEILFCSAAILLTPFIVWHAMQWLHDRRHGKRRPIIAAPTAHAVQEAVGTALAKSARTYRVAERCDPRL